MGNDVGFDEGSVIHSLGRSVGLSVGSDDIGKFEGVKVFSTDGAIEGTTVGLSVGIPFELIDGALVGSSIGLNGANVGTVDGGSDRVSLLYR